MNAILSRANNLRGPLREKTKEEILRYVRCPSPTKAMWESLAHIVIRRGGVTIWRAMTELDPNFQTKIPAGAVDAEARWDRAPDGFTVARAIREALKEVK